MNVFTSKIEIVLLTSEMLTSFTVAFKVSGVCVSSAFLVNEIPTCLGRVSTVSICYPETNFRFNSSCFLLPGCCVSSLKLCTCWLAALLLEQMRTPRVEGRDCSSLENRGILGDDTGSGEN